MKIIWKEYGKGILAVMAVLGTLLLVILLLHSTSKQNPVSGQEKDYGMNWDSAELERIYARDNPSIVFLQKEEVTAGCGSEALENCFEAKDAENEPLQVQICAVCNEAGENCSYPLRYPGIYTVEVSAVDKFYKKTSRVFHVPVNRGTV